MLMKLKASLSYVWLLMAILTTGQPSEESSPPVLDSDGQALQAGVEYYVRPAIPELIGGRFTLINRNNSCPLYVGQVNRPELEGFPLIFTPFAEGETVVREDRDFKVEFSAVTICIQSTAWKVGERQEATQRRLIVTGETEPAVPGKTNPQSVGGYFNIARSQELDAYEFDWCPLDVCPSCRLICSRVGNLVEDGKRLLALDGSDLPALPVLFDRA